LGLALFVLLLPPIGPVAGQSGPKLAEYFRPLPFTVLDPSYGAAAVFPALEDLNGDGNQDLLVLGAWYPGNGRICCTPQPGGVYLGDGFGRFTPAPRDQFPLDTVLTVHPRKVLFADFNGDGRQDAFVSTHGWDADSFPGEQNRLLLSTPEGGWRDATDALPRKQDYSHSSAAGDMSGRGIIDIFVNNAVFIATRTTGDRYKPYSLLNTGSGVFAETTANIPVGRNQLLDNTSVSRRSPSSTLTDLNADGLPELIIGSQNGSPNDVIRKTTILWNRQGQFVDSDVTLLPEPAIFKNRRADYDIQAIDINQDGLQDLLVVGIQQVHPLSSWFVQVLINKGHRQFVDETASRLLPEDSWGGQEGVSTTAPLATWVKPIDFNHDGAPDFYVEFTSGTRFESALPLVWLNDGTGHFTTLKLRDFVTAFDERLINFQSELVPMRNGFAILRFDSVAGVGLRVSGVLPVKPYR
jgi:hypothetical protein